MKKLHYALIFLSVAVAAGADTAAPSIPVPDSGSKSAQQINDLRDQLALLQAEATVASAKTALDTATGTKSADQKLADTIDAIKKFGAAMPKGNWDVQAAATTSPEAIYQNFAGLRVAALRFAAALRARDGARFARTPLVFVPFGQEAVAPTHLREFEAQFKQVDASWKRFYEEIGRYQATPHYWDKTDEQNTYYVSLIDMALKASPPSASDKAPSIAPLIGAAPDIVNAMAGLFKSDTTESVGTSGLVDESLQSAIAEGLFMDKATLVSYTKTKPPVPASDLQPVSVYLDRDVYLTSTGKPDDKIIEGKAETVALYAYGAVRVKSYVDAILAPQAKDFDSKMTNLADARKAITDAQAAVKSLSKPPDDETKEAAAKRLKSLGDAQETLTKRPAEVAKLEGEVSALANSTSRMKSLSDRLNDFLTTATSFLAKLATKVGEVPLTVMLVREAQIENHPTDFVQLSVKILAQGASTITTKYAFWTTRKADAAIAIEYRLSSVRGQLFDAGVYAENNYVAMGDKKHASTEDGYTR